MSEVAIAVTGISLFLYVFKLCEYFESELCKAIKRKRKLEELDSNSQAIDSQENVIRYYSLRGCFVLLPSFLLFCSFLIALCVYFISLFVTSISNILQLFWACPYLLGAIIPVIGAYLGMKDRPTIKYFEAIYSEITELKQKQQVQERAQARAQARAEAEAEAEARAQAGAGAQARKKPKSVKK